MQAIVTKYLGPTNTKGSRIKATADAGSVTVSYSHAAYDPYRVAALALVEKLGWSDMFDNGYRLVGGSLPKTSDKVFVWTHETGGEW